MRGQILLRHPPMKAHGMRHAQLGCQTLQRRPAVALANEVIHQVWKTPQERRQGSYDHIMPFVLLRRADASDSQEGGTIHGVRCRVRRELRVETVMQHAYAASAQAVHLRGTIGGECARRQRTMGPLERKAADGREPFPHLRTVQKGDVRGVRQVRHRVSHGSEMGVLGENEVEREPGVRQCVPDERAPPPVAASVCHPFHHGVTGTVVERQDGEVSTRLNQRTADDAAMPGDSPRRSVEVGDQV